MKELEVIINNIDGVNVVSSRDVANSFNKRHGDVVRSIEDKMEVNAILRSPNYFSVLRLIDEGVTEIIKNRPCEQINWF